jgi:predicted lipoprotein with Yx(FWY)xxD motif
MGGEARFSAEHGQVTVDAAPVGTLGTVLVANKGFALYMFPPDAAGQGASDDDGGYWYARRPRGRSSATDRADGVLS